MTAVLYVRVPDEVKQELQSLVEQTGLSLAKVTEIVLLRGLGQTWESLSGVQKLNAILDDRR